MHASELNAGRREYCDYSKYDKALLRSGFTEFMRDFNTMNPIQAVVSTVALNDYRAIGPENLPPPEKICADDCLASLIRSTSIDDDLHICYDRGETFFSHIQNSWNNKRAREKDPCLARIKLLQSVKDWRQEPAVQAADCLGYWIMRAEQGGTWVFRRQMLTANLPVWGTRFDRDRLLGLVAR